MLHALEHCDMETLAVEPRHHLPSLPSLAIPAEVARALPEAVRAELAMLPPEQQSAFLRGYLANSKSLAMAYLCSLIYCHYLLLGRWTMTGFMLLSLFVAAALGTVWWIIDLFRMPFLVSRHNQQVATAVLRNVRQAGGEPSRLAPC